VVNFDVSLSLIGANIAWLPWSIGASAT